MGLNDTFQEVATSKPLFLTIYTTVIVGIVVSSLYVFSAVYSAADSSPDSTRWLSSSPSTLSNVDIHQESNSSLLPTALAVPRRPGKPIWEVPTQNTKMPPLKEFRLTKELVQERAKDNVIIVTFGNFAFMDFILTWVKHLTDLGVYNILVGAMDTKLLEALYWKGVPVFDMESHMSTVDVGWGSPTFHKMGREKVILIDSILPFGVELLMCDTDMVWLKNPLPYLDRYPEADVLTSSDQVVPTVVDDSLDIWQQVGAAYNIGIFHWRPTESAKKLAKEWKEMLLADDKIWDQTGFNDIVHRQLGPSVDDDSGLLYAFDGNLKLGLLPASIFCSGHTYFVQFLLFPWRRVSAKMMKLSIISAKKFLDDKVDKGGAISSEITENQGGVTVLLQADQAMYQQLRLEPYAVHTTFQYAGTEGKRHRLREGMVFYDPPQYYDVPGGFLSFKPSIPKSLLFEGEHNIESHFKLINYQMKQIRTAFAIASILNRTLVMPPLWCRLDRLWFPHPGVLEGSLTRQPFICPLDHVFEINTMLKELPEDEFGPGISIREYSFLDNPSMPKQVKDLWLNVQLCQVGAKDCQLSNSTNSKGVLRLPKQGNEDTMKTVFSNFKDIKVIQFSSMQDAFSGFTDKAREDKFRNRMKHYVGIWCCTTDHIPGHIYYDMYWDEKPNWKPIPPQTAQDDHPPW